MTPAELAEELSKANNFNYAQVGLLAFNNAPLLAAALRLAESCTRERDDYGVWLDFDTDALANYRAARERLAP